MSRFFFLNVFSIFVSSMKMENIKQKYLDMTACFMRTASLSSSTVCEQEEEDKKKKYHYAIHILCSSSSYAVTFIDCQSVNLDSMRTEEDKNKKCQVAM